MQLRYFVQSLHETRDAIEKVVYSLLYSLADVSLPNGMCRHFDRLYEWRSFVLCGRDVVVCKPKSEACWPSSFVRTKNIDSVIHPVTFRTVLYLIPKF
jgi:hypothetical protein